MKRRHVVIFITCATRGEARRIAKALVAKRLAACANIVPGIESLFRWKGRIDRATEVLVIVKTRAGHFKRVEEEVKRLHSYEVPEIVMIPITEGSAPYLDWIDSSVSSKGA